MIKLSLALILLFSFPCFAQTGTVSVMDFVKIKNNRMAETLYYYENNWKLYRDIALEKNYIVSYKLVRTTADSLANFDLVLITEYADSTQFKLGEERFGKIIKAVRPNGPVRLNDIMPNDFRKNVFAKEAHTIFSPLRK